MYKFCFFVPESHLDCVKQAVFAASGGRIGEYEYCCWQTLGEGQFRPSADARPFIGKAGKLEKLAEWKVEMVVSDGNVRAAVDALKASHPYETPAYEVWQLADF
jgi:hypothetical protein